MTIRSPSLEPLAPALVLALALEPSTCAMLQLAQYRPGLCRRTRGVSTCHIDRREREEEEERSATHRRHAHAARDPPLVLVAPPAPRPALLLLDPARLTAQPGPAPLAPQARTVPRAPERLDPLGVVHGLGALRAQRGEVRERRRRRGERGPGPGRDRERRERVGEGGRRGEARAAGAHRKRASLIIVVEVGRGDLGRRRRRDVVTRLSRGGSACATDEGGGFGRKGRTSRLGGRGRGCGRKCACWYRGRPRCGRGCGWRPRRGRFERGSRRTGWRGWRWWAGCGGRAKVRSSRHGGRCGGCRRSSQ